MLTTNAKHAHRPSWGETSWPAGSGSKTPSPPLPAVPTFPLWAVSVADPAAWGDAVDTLQPSEVVLYAAGTAPLEARIGDKLGATFTPIGSAPRPEGLGLRLAALDLLCAQFGFDDEGQSDDRWSPEGEAAMRVVLDEVAGLQQEMRRWRGEVEVLMRSAEALGRHFGMSPDRIAAVTGRPCALRRVLLEPMRRAHELAEQRLAEEQEVEAAKAAAVAAAEDLERERSLDELQVDAVAVKIGRTGAPYTTEPWYGATRLWETDEEAVYGFQHVQGVTMPRFASDGVRSVDPSTVPPRTMAQAPEADAAALEFVHAQRLVAGHNFGAVPTLSAFVPAVARSLAEEWAPTILAPQTKRQWRVDWIVELFCREFRIQPDVALSVLMDPLDAHFEKTHPPMRIPKGVQRHDLDGLPTTALEYREVPTFLDAERPSRVMADSLGAKLVEATKIGRFVAIEPLEAPRKEPTSATTKKKSR